MMQGATCFAFLKTSLTPFSDSPTHFERSSGPLMLMKLASLSFAAALCYTITRNLNSCIWFNSHRRLNTIVNGLFLSPYHSACDQCDQKFGSYKDLIAHTRYVHHHPIVKCHECGEEFIHEKDRLHHVREEHEQKLEHRIHKLGHNHNISNPQEEVDEHIRNFGDNF